MALIKNSKVLKILTNRGNSQQNPPPPVSALVSQATLLQHKMVQISRNTMGEGRVLATREEEWSIPAQGLWSPNLSPSHWWGIELLESKWMRCCCWLPISAFHFDLSLMWKCLGRCGRWLTFLFLAARCDLYVDAGWLWPYTSTEATSSIFRKRKRRHSADPKPVGLQPWNEDEQKGLSSLPHPV